MIMKEMEKNNEENNKMMTVIERLPALNEKSVTYALSNGNMSYLLDHIQGCLDGQYWRAENTGITLQRVNEKTLRIITIVDHNTPYRVLAMMKMTCNKIGINLQIDPYAVVMPYEPEEEVGVPPVEEPGPEVA